MDPMISKFFHFSFTPRAPLLRQRAVGSPFTVHRSPFTVHGSRFGSVRTNERRDDGIDFSSLERNPTVGTSRTVRLEPRLEPNRTELSRENARSLSLLVDWRHSLAPERTADGDDEETVVGDDSGDALRRRLVDDVVGNAGVGDGTRAVGSDDAMRASGDAGGVRATVGRVRARRGGDDAAGTVVRGVREGNCDGFAATGKGWRRRRRR